MTEGPKPRKKVRRRSRPQAEARGSTGSSKQQGTSGAQQRRRRTSVKSRAKKTGSSKSVESTKNEAEEPTAVEPMTAQAPRMKAPPPPETPPPDYDGDFDDETELGIGSRVVPPALGANWFGLDNDGLEEVGELEEAAVSWGTDDEQMREQIRTLEARLDGMIRKAGNAEPEEEEEGPQQEPRTADPDAEADSPVEAQLSQVEAARELFASEYYRRKWGRLGLRQRAERVDDFGWAPDFEARLKPFIDGAFRYYFRGKILGAEHVPAEGRCVIVANHSGTLPLDGLMLRSALSQRREAPRELRWLAEDFLFYLPFLGVFLNRLGAVRACQENAERLLSQEALIAAFPEGEKGASKLYKDRYKLQRFGRGGYIRLCLRTGSPLLPCAIIGAEETNPMLFRLEYISKLFGLPYLPITPTFPLLGPLGLIPAPAKWRIVVGEPMDLDQYGPEAAHDQVLVSRLSEQVRIMIQELIQRGLRDRGSPWSG